MYVWLPSSMVIKITNVAKPPPRSPLDVVIDVRGLANGALRRKLISFENQKMKMTFDWGDCCCSHAMIEPLWHEVSDLQSVDSGEEEVSPEGGPFRLSYSASSHASGVGACQDGLSDGEQNGELGKAYGALPWQDNAAYEQAARAVQQEGEELFDGPASWEQLDEEALQADASHLAMANMRPLPPAPDEKAAQGAGATGTSFAAITLPILPGDEDLNDDPLGRGSINLRTCTLVRLCRLPTMLLACLCHAGLT